MDYRTEKDLLGEKNIPKDVYWGIHTNRAVENFPLSDLKFDPVLITAYAYIKKAACLINQDLGFIDKEKGNVISRACDEIISGLHREAFIVDCFSGGAGTSLNMNLNEVIANRALVLMGKEPGQYDFISPLEDINLHQSTNDTFPTAIKVAAMLYLRQLEEVLTELQRTFQDKEKEFRSIVKIGRTETQAAVPMTLGAEFSGFAEVFAQDRWRIFKVNERLRTVNLGGTAVGTGLAAPREYIFLVTDKLKELTGLNLCRAENLIYATQNADSFCEASGILKTLAVDLVKVSRDLRLSAMLGEINFEPVQAGSSIMPGKVNPVLAEAVIQAGLRCLSNDSTLSHCAAYGTLQINEFMPLIAHTLLESLKLLINAVKILDKAVKPLSANLSNCQASVDVNPVIMTAFLPELGYDKVLELVKEYSQKEGLGVRTFLNKKLGKEMVDKVLSGENLTRLGFPLNKKKKNG